MRNMCVCVCIYSHFICSLNRFSSVNCTHNEQFPLLMILVAGRGIFSLHRSHLFSSFFLPHLIQLSLILCLSVSLPLSLTISINNIVLHRTHCNFATGCAAHSFLPYSNNRCAILFHCIY